MTQYPYVPCPLVPIGDGGLSPKELMGRRVRGGGRWGDWRSRQACSSHHQIVIWICLYFSICLLRRQRCLSLSWSGVWASHCTGVSRFQKSQPATSETKQKRQELALCFVDHRHDFLQFGLESVVSISAVSTRMREHSCSPLNECKIKYKIILLCKS